MLAEPLALTTYSAALEVPFSQELGPDTAPYEFEQAITDGSADQAVVSHEGSGLGVPLPADLSPEAAQQADRIIRSVVLNAAGAAYHVDTADDGSLLLEVEHSRTAREILFAISPKSAKVYFSTSEAPSLNGIVTLQRGLESLLHWVAGTGQIAKESLLLASK